MIFPGIGARGLADIIPLISQVIDPLSVLFKVLSRFNSMGASVFKNLWPMTALIVSSSLVLEELVANRTLSPFAQSMTLNVIPTLKMASERRKQWYS